MSDTHRLVTRDGRVAVVVLSYGLTIQAIEVQAHGRVHDVLAGPEDPRVHKTHRQFFGPVIGRYANRLPAGPSETPDVAVHLEEWGGAQIHHHGGPQPAASPAESIEQRGPWDCVVWSHVEEPQLFDAQVLGAWDAAGVWAIESPDGDQGYPGRLRVEACVGVRAVPARIGDVHVEYRAQLMDATDATPLNMTQHWGFFILARMMAAYWITRCSWARPARTSSAWRWTRTVCLPASLCRARTPRTTGSPASGSAHRCRRMAMTIFTCGAGAQSVWRICKAPVAWRWT